MSVGAGFFMLWLWNVFFVLGCDIGALAWVWTRTGRRNEREGCGGSDWHRVIEGAELRLKARAQGVGFCAQGVGFCAEGGARCFGCRAGRRVVCAFEVYAFGARAGVVRAYEVYAFGVCAGVVCAGVLSELVLDTEVEELRVVLLYESVVLGVKSDILILVIQGSFEDGAVALIEVCVVADVVPSGA